MIDLVLQLRHRGYLLCYLCQENQEETAEHQHPPDPDFRPTVPRSLGSPRARTAVAGFCLSVCGMLSADSVSRCETGEGRERS